ncbi:MAG: secretin N-terminal domain-containing protein, partial [Planctomycetota bacterium]
VEPEEAPPERRAPLGAASEEAGGAAVAGWVGRELQVFPVRWGRAEDLAAVLEPVVQSLYGPEARVVPHVGSNKIFVYIPSRRAENAPVRGRVRGTAR